MSGTKKLLKNIPEVVDDQGNPTGINYVFRPGAKIVKMPEYLYLTMDGIKVMKRHYTNNVGRDHPQMLVVSDKILNLAEAIVDHVNSYNDDKILEKIIVVPIPFLNPNFWAIAGAEGAVVTEME